METWKDITGYEQYYQISNLGKVKSKERFFLRNGNKVCLPEKILATYISHAGYLCIKLCKDAKTKHFSIHRLIAIHFIPFVVSKNHVNHINGIKTDNSIGNLEWCNHAENMLHANKTGLIVRNAKQYEAALKNVIDTSTGKVYRTAKEASNDIGVKYNTLRSYLLGNRQNKTNLKYVLS